MNLRCVAWLLVSALLATGSACGEPTGGTGGGTDIADTNSADVQTAAVEDIQPRQESFRLVSAKATAPGDITLTFNAPVLGGTDVPLSHFSVPGLLLHSAHVGDDPTTVHLDTAHHVSRGYNVAVTDLKAKDGRGIDPLWAVTVLDGHAPPAVARLDANMPKKWKQLLAMGWKVVDHSKATKDGPSKWALSGTTITQASNIHGGDTAWHIVERHGTWLLLDRPTPADAFIEARLRSTDDDALGLVLRWSSEDEHYRFEWDRQRWRRRIVRVHKGVSTELAADALPFADNSWQRVRFSAIGARLVVQVNGKVVLSALDNKVTAGQAGLFSWGNDAAQFRGVIIQPVHGGKLVRRGPLRAVRPDAPIATHRVAASDPNHEGALLWARASEDAAVTFEVATSIESFQNTENPGFSHVTPTLQATAAADRTVQVEVKGLKPATRYYFRPVLARLDAPQRRNPGPVGSFWTAPLPTEATAIAIGLIADVHQNYPAPFSALAQLRKRKPALVLSLGDMPYADAAPAAKNEAGYHDQLRRIRVFDELAATFQHHPLVGTWDDHEVKNNWDAKTDKKLVAAGTKAWHRWFPTRAATGDGSTYRTFRWGKHLQVFVLDTRFHRAANSAKDGASKSMLGAAQRDWLFASLKASTATWKAIVTTVPLRYGTTGSDHWAGFAHERGLLFKHLKAHKISGVFFLAGDQHWAAVHHHPEGFVEVQACPISAPLRDPPKKLAKEVVFAAKKRSFGLLTISADGTDAVVEIRGEDGGLLRAEKLSP